MPKARWLALPAFLLSGTTPENLRLEKLRTPNPVLGAKQDVVYEEQIHGVGNSSRLYVFSDWVYEFTRKDGSIRRVDDFFDYILQSFHLKQSNLDHLLNHAWKSTRDKEFDDDFTILEISIE